MILWKIKDRYQFYQYWHLDLLNDSFKIQENEVMFGSQEATIKAGKYIFNQDSVITIFIRQQRNWKSGQIFFHRSSEGELYCFPQHIIQYKKDTLTKLIFFNDRNPTLRDLINLANRLNSLNNLKKLSPETDLKDNILIAQLLKRSDFESFAPATMVQETIKFMPPKAKN